jgi:hypothetical protein
LEMLCIASCLVSKHLQNLGDICLIIASHPSSKLQQINTTLCLSYFLQKIPSRDLVNPNKLNTLRFRIYHILLSLAKFIFGLEGAAKSEV